MILAEKIIQLRKQNGWSQEELAENLGISRQSVSKWESGASIPDIERIIKMSELFGVSTDYLIKDELEEVSFSESKDKYEEDNVKSVSVEDANSYIDVSRIFARQIANAVTIFILSPVLVILLDAFAEAGKMSEDMAGGIGASILLVMVAIGAAICVFNGMRMGKYEYMEKQVLSLQYGVKGIVEKKKENFADTFRKCIASGVTLCIVGVIPLIMMDAFGASELVEVIGLAALLVLVAVGVNMIVWSSIIQGSFQKLLQEGDYSVEKKETNRKLEWLAGVYWCLTTAIYLGISFYTLNWHITWVIWPVAGVLYGAILAIAGRTISKQCRNKVEIFSGFVEMHTKPLNLSRLSRFSLLKS